MRLEDIEHAKFRAQAQIVLDKDKGVTAFEEYMKIAFPYLESVKRREKDDHIKALNQWIGQGPLQVTPMLSPKLNSRMKNQAAALKRGKGSDKLYSKLRKKSI